MDWFQFIGRFHPLVVHLPIGFVVFGLLLEGMALIGGRNDKAFNRVISFSYLASALSALLSAIIGLFLAQGGGYEEQTLFWHKWLGISLILLSSIAWWLKKKDKGLKNSWQSLGLMAAIFFLVSFTGHLGGSLTHGEGYLLANAPDFVKNVFGEADTAPLSERLPESPDSIIVFSHLIQPILEKKCVSCHNPNKSKAGLDLSSIEGIQKGGDEGPVISSGKPLGSELFHRISLPTESKKFMPPKGNGLSFGELELIKWWIANDAPFEKPLSNFDVPETLQALLLRDFKIDARPKSSVELLQAGEVSADQVLKLSSLGFELKLLSSTTNLVDVKFGNDDFSVSDARALEEIGENIVWLDLAGKKLDAEAIEIIANFPNLLRLDLGKSTINDHEFKALTQLNGLELLNVYGTDLGPKAFEDLGSLKKLKTIYVWGTRLSISEYEALKQKFPNINIIGGAKDSSDT